MRQPAGVFRDATIVGETRDRFYVRERRKNRYESAAVGFCTKHDMAFDLGEQGMIGTHADIKAGMPGGAALTCNDVAGNHMLAAVGLDPEPLARRITSVTR